MTSRGPFSSQPAPCGRIVDAHDFLDQDDEVIVTREVEFACGCRSIHHEYHDGSVSRTIVRHDGRVLLDELHSAE